MGNIFCKYVSENLGSFILHFSQSLSKTITAIIWQWEALFSLEVNGSMLNKKHNLEERLPKDEDAGK